MEGLRWASYVLQTGAARSSWEEPVSAVLHPRIQIPLLVRCLNTCLLFTAVESVIVFLDFVTTIRCCITSFKVICSDADTNLVSKLALTQHSFFWQWKDRGPVCTVRQGKRKQKQSFCQVQWHFYYPTLSIFKVPVKLKRSIPFLLWNFAAFVNVGHSLSKICVPS